ncbi:flavin reductase family protein [Caulobacter sp. 17J80-11]|uniref:flavin reductase family protein n=1 Tax=Caulobacter sp. 17J80-11 TaxID=2763502 RepID=UPI0021054AAC|nr:flavin reductase family protein [Caulobacter sp. 17J80-11]
MRDAFACFATGVAVVTTEEHGRPVGATINSFSSVSLDPPLVLFCLDRRLGALAAFEQARTYAVNVLHDGQEAVSARFGRPGPDRFETGRWTPGRFGAPVLLDAMATFELGRHAAYDGGDHVIFVCRVLDAAWSPEHDPLLFFQGRYRSVHVPD